MKYTQGHFICKCKKKVFLLHPKNLQKTVKTKEEDSQTLNKWRKENKEANKQNITKNSTEMLQITYFWKIHKITRDKRRP